MGYLSQFKGLSNLIGWERERTKQGGHIFLRGRKARIPGLRPRGRKGLQWGRGQETHCFLYHFTGSSQKWTAPRGGLALWWQGICFTVSDIFISYGKENLFWTSLFTEKCLCILLGCTRSHSILYLLYCIVLYSESFFFLISWIQKLILLLACFKNVNEGTVSFLI